MTKRWEDEPPSPLQWFRLVPFELTYRPPPLMVSAWKPRKLGAPPPMSGVRAQVVELAADPTMSIAAIAEKVGVSRQRVSQIVGKRPRYKKPPPPPKPPKPSLEERFLSKIDQRTTGECWPWTGNKIPAGYGVLNIQGRTRYGHRWAYEYWVGPIPEGLVIDHLCRNRECCNPAHLEPVTSRENVLRGEGMGARNARKTHCKRGHPLPAEGNRRKCARCAAERGMSAAGREGDRRRRRRYLERKKARLQAAQLQLEGSAV